MLETLEKVKLKAKQITRKHVLRKQIECGVFYASGRKNIGDSISPWIVEKVAGQPIEYSNPLETNGPHLLAVGSILESATKDCTVWGSGFIQQKSHPKQEPAYIAAVRGPLTAARLSELGMSSTRTFGDPAILLPKFVSIGTRRNPSKIGLIPHYADKPYLSKSTIWRSEKAKFVNIETDNLTSFLSDLDDCELVISSSLHGIIIAEAYGIPAIWAEFDDRVTGGHFKFHDYYLSTGREITPESFYSINETQAAKSRTPPIGISQLAEDLFDAFPEKFKA